VAQAVAYRTGTTREKECRRLCVHSRASFVARMVIQCFAAMSLPPSRPSGEGRGGGVCNHKKLYPAGGRRQLRESMRQWRVVWTRSRNAVLRAARPTAEPVSVRAYRCVIRNAPATPIEAERQAGGGVRGGEAVAPLALFRRATNVRVVEIAPRTGTTSSAKRFKLRIEPVVP